MASLKRVTHKNGRVVYRIVICLGYDGQGNKLVKNLTYSVNQSATPRQQEREALKYAMDMEDKLKYGSVTDCRKLSFEEFARQWLENVRNNLTYGTYVGYEQLLRKGILPYFKAYRIANVRTADVEAFYRTLADEYSAGTIKRYANVLNCIFSTARRWSLIESNPCQGAIKPKGKQEKRELRYFTPAQALTFLKSLDGLPTQYRIFYMLSIFCGFRKGEVLALKWEDIDFERQEISITKSIGKTEAGFDYKEPKNEASVRRTPFPDSILPLLEEYRREYDLLKERMGDRWQGRDNLFIRRDGGLMGHSAVYQHFVKHLRRYNGWVAEHPEEARKAGLELLPVIPLHGLRHSCATLLNHLDVSIVDISKYLGHANCSTTMNIYAHSFEAQKRAAGNKLNDFLHMNLQI